MPPLLAAMCVFSFSMSISPGPVNMVIVSSGANHGFRRTQPFVAGATLGFTVLLALVGFVLLRTLGSHAQAMRALGLAGAAFILYVGWRIARAPAALAVAGGAAPTFLQGALLQWLNPKAWIACASGASLFSRPDDTGVLALFIAVYCVVCYASLAAWALLGERVKAVLHGRLRMRAFNVTMGALLAASALYLGWAQLQPL